MPFLRCNFDVSKFKRGKPRNVAPFKPTPRVCDGIVPQLEVPCHKRGTLICATYKGCLATSSETHHLYMSQTWVVSLYRPCTWAHALATRPKEARVDIYLAYASYPQCHKSSAGTILQRCLIEVDRFTDRMSTAYLTIGMTSKPVVRFSFYKEDNLTLLHATTNSRRWWWWGTSHSMDVQNERL